MNTKCSFCGYVDNITSSPNKVEGYFIDNLLLEKMSARLINTTRFEDAESLIRLVSDYSCRCSKCGNITNMEHEEKDKERRKNQKLFSRKFKVFDNEECDKIVDDYFMEML